MVIGDRFVWAHMPKTGGDSTHELFRILNPSIDIDSIRQAAKHHTFTQREKTTKLDLTHARRRIMNIRRLPTWLLSHAKHRERNNGYPVEQDLLREGRFRQVHNVTRAHRVARLATAPAILIPGRTRRILKRHVIRWLTKPGESLSADLFLTRMMCGRVDHWIRVEHLADDFLHVLSQFEKVSDEQKREILALPPQNTGDYPRELDRWFDRDALAQVYETNPVWMGIERQVYGAALIDLDVTRRAA